MRIEENGIDIGYVRVERSADRPDTATIWCEVEPQHRRQGHGLRATRAAVEHALNGDGFARIEAYVDAEDRSAQRLASRAGMRREGLARGYASGTDGARRDHLLFARLAGDPPVGSGEMFRATLNAGLPRTRTIAQGMIRNQRGAVLLCELIYKQQWDLPGGVVDPGESPATAVVREVVEELQLDCTVTGLQAVSWLPPWRGWDDALLYLFEVEGATGPLEDQVAAAVLEEREIRAVHWADPATVRERCAPYTARLIEHVLAKTEPGTTYLENGDLPGWAQR